MNLAHDSTSRRIAATSILKLPNARHLRTFLDRHPMDWMTSLLRARLPLSMDFGSSGLPCTQAGTIGAPGAGVADFGVIQMPPPYFLRLLSWAQMGRRCRRRRRHMSY
jgi:hypothetical protein